MTAQLYPDLSICRVFDADDQPVADLPLGAQSSLTIQQKGSRALMKIGLVRIGGWRKAPWGWEIDVQIRD